jgi:hypothetical protein
MTPSSVIPRLPSRSFMFVPFKLEWYEHTFGRCVAYHSNLNGTSTCIYLSYMSLRLCENTGIVAGIVSGYVVRRNPQRRPGTHPRSYRTPLHSTILKTHPSTQYGNAARTPPGGSTRVSRTPPRPPGEGAYASKPNVDTYVAPWSTAVHMHLRQMYAEVFFSTIMY